MRTAYWHRLEGWILYSYASLVWRTARYQVRGQEIIKRLSSTGRSFVVAAWHGMTMMYAGYLTSHGDADQYLSIVVDDTRGPMLADFARRMGATPFAVSMKEDSMLAARRLIALIRQLQRGKRLVLNPDGPDGPSHEPKPGAAFIARKAQVPIVPLGAYTASGLRIPRWDRYVIPFPSSRIALAFGEPLQINPGDDLEQARQILKAQLNQVEQAAEQTYRVATRD